MLAAFSALTLALFTGSENTEQTMPEAIGPTPIRFYSGNLSVGLFMDYWGTHKGGDLGAVNDAMIATLKRTSCTAMCDYIAWCCAEPEEGHWDWSFYQGNAARLKDAGVDYNVFCWLHFPPKWYETSDRFVPYKNLVTGETIPQLSLWSPDLPRVFDAFYGRLAKVLGNEIPFLRLAMPSEYGEIGYCAGMTSWLRPQEHAQRGYWCGDDYALRSYREFVLRTLDSVSSVNKTWGTDFASEADIVPPDPSRIEPELGSSFEKRLYWALFIEWYQQAWTDCLREVSGIVAKHFPGKECIASLGYGEEMPCLGNDQSRHIEAMAELGLAAQTPGDIGFFATRRVSSACRHFGVPYYTEPPADVPRERQLNRIFMDISNGVQTWFDYLQNMDRARDLFVKYKEHLTGLPPRNTIAVWHPTLDHWLHPNERWSPQALELSDPLRDLTDYEVVDDRMITTGALDKLGIHQLVLAGSTWIDSIPLVEVGKWVKRGGVFIALQETPLTDIFGETNLLPMHEFPVWPQAGDVLHLDAPQIAGRYVLDVCAPESRNSLVGKWYQVEQTLGGHVRWAAPGAGVVLPLRQGRSYEVHVGATNVPNGKATPIEVDGQPARVVDPDGTGRAVLTIPAKGEDAGGTRLATLRFTGKGTRPKDVMDSPDTRLLAAYVGKIAVQEVGADDEKPLPAPQIHAAWDTEYLWSKAFKHGEGLILAINPERVSTGRIAELVAKLCFEAGDKVKRPDWNARNVDGEGDGLLATVFDDKILYFNTTASPIVRHMAYRESDFAEGRRPAELSWTLQVPARTIVSVPLG